jgi:hypothetical protein
MTPLQDLNVLDLLLNTIHFDYALIFAPQYPLALWFVFAIIAARHLPQRGVDNRLCDLCRGQA